MEGYQKVSSKMSVILEASRNASGPLKKKKKESKKKKLG